MNSNETTVNIGPQMKITNNIIAVTRMVCTYNVRVP